MAARLGCCLLALLVSTLATAQNADREAKQLSNEPEQKYDLELSFPVDSIEATNAAGSIERIDQLIREILADENLAKIDNLPETELDKASIIFEESSKCESGHVVRDDKCVPCPAGKYYNEADKTCTNCPIGFYNDREAQLACTKCPLTRDIESVTEDIGSKSVDKCKEKCAAGHKYDPTTDLCLPCGYGSYQAEEGKFQCSLCGVGLTTRTTRAISAAECRPDCEDGHQLSINGECDVCPVGTYRTQGLDQGCQDCPVDLTTSQAASRTKDDCNLPICIPGQFLNATDNQCQSCAMGSYQPDKQQTSCIECPENTSTLSDAATSREDCINPCLAAKNNGRDQCDRNANCLFKSPNSFKCVCKTGYNGTGTVGLDGRPGCRDNCEGLCRNGGLCAKDKEGRAFCQCAGSFTGVHCEEKSEFAYIAGGIAGAVLFVIVLVLLIWMICVRSGRNRRGANEKFAPPNGSDPHGSQVNFYYGAPAPYAESIAPSQHGSTYAHYYEDEEDGWGMPNFYDTYGKNSKLARSNGSLYNAGMYGPQYAPQGELYDRLGRHAYQPRPEDKSGNDTTSESDDDRSRRQ